MTALKGSTKARRGRKDAARATHPARRAQDDRPHAAHRARKRFGQHFLEPAWVEKVLRAIAPAHDETFLEIGPGRGAMTRPLADLAGRVVAFEIDRDLAGALEAAARPRLTIIEGDFLEISADRIRSLLPVGERSRPIRVAGNLPYNVASPILFRLVDLVAAGVPIGDAHVMLQREVADRLVAAPGTGDYGVLTVLIRHAADAGMVLSLPPGAFRPPPAVQSALVRLRFHPPDPPVQDLATFRRLVQSVFTRRRKTLANALLAYHAGGPAQGEEPASIRPAEALARAGIDGSRRPQTLEIAEFARLADVFAAAGLTAQHRAVL
jgi:16S rRNA (adenine1518-N6/adenine1519-N6)-dimethyltransferase